VKDPALVGAVRDFMSASDPPATGTRQNVYYYNLANQEASTVAAAVNRMTGNLFPADLQPTVVELPETNALMITAEPRQYRTIRRMIDRIDYTVPSVLLDATLVEVQLNEQVGYGVEWFLNEVGDDIAFDFSSNFRNLTQAAGAQTTAGLLYLPENWFVVLDLLQDRTELSILSRPRISVSNGDTARLNSTDDIPIVTSEISTQATADANIRTNIERREFGLQLEITPKIADDGSIDLEILIEDSRRGQDESVGEITQPTFNVRRVETNVKVQNGRTILIGGLFQRRDQNQVQGIPGAVDVPVLGKLFGTEVDDNQRTELLVFVTPYVVMDPDTSEALGRTFSRGLGVDERGAPVTLPSVPPANGETADDEEDGS
jgi:general secretion pathway protein D